MTQEDGGAPDHHRCSEAQAGLKFPRREFGAECTRVDALARQDVFGNEQVRASVGPRDTPVAPARGEPIIQSREIRGQVHIEGATHVICELTQLPSKAAAYFRHELSQFRTAPSRFRQSQPQGEVPGQTICFPTRGAHLEPPPAVRVKAR